MNETEEYVELVKAIESMRRKTADAAVLDLCDRIMRATQRLSMAARNVSEQEQQACLQPLPTKSTGGKTPWANAGVSKATWYRRQREKVKKQ